MSGLSSPVVSQQSATVSITHRPASSSAVTIPTPGKSILKKPPPPPAPLLSRFTKLLPFSNNNATANTQGNASGSGSGGKDAKEEERRALKRAHFILPRLATVYPISAANPPHMPTTQEEKRGVEARERERRRRVVRQNSFSYGRRGSTASQTASGEGEGSAAKEEEIREDDEDEEPDYWSMEKVEGFYRECCEGRDEFPHPRISAALKAGHGTTPRTVDLSGVQISLVSAHILSDVLSIEWGLRKLIFKESDLDEQILKPLLHALLIPESLHFLSVASNRRLKTPAYRLIGAWLARAKALRFLDLSQNPLDKQAVQYIAAALTQAPPSTLLSPLSSTDDSSAQAGLESLKLDDCALKPAALEALAHTVRTSSLKNISLRHNRISPTGSVALALMIKDYPDSNPSGSSASGSSVGFAYGGGLMSPTASNSSSVVPSPASSVVSLPTSPISPTGASFASGGGLGNSLSARLAAAVTSPALPPPAAPRALPPPSRGPLLPPPQHPAAASNPAGLPTTTYTPYVPRAKRMQAARSEGNPLAADGRSVPVFSSSGMGGVTARHVSTTSAQVPLPAPAPVGVRNGAQQQRDSGPSAALLDKVRQLDALPRLGALQTLDLKGNEIRTGVGYIAQVLKRNRTLKVLNLSENKLDVQGLVQIADALKYNACLETLDLSRNPCCGPSLEGIHSLRTAFTLNTALKQLFLTATGLTSLGAIALAEFLPESASLLALGLTENAIDLAGVMALSGGLKSNHVMRCLDLSIPVGDEEMARGCREIFNTCVRNTEEADRASKDAAAAEREGETEEEREKGAVWGMIDKSQLAKAIRLDDAKKSATELPGQVREVMAEMDVALAKAYKAHAGKPLADVDAPLAARGQDLQTALGKLVQKSANADPSKLEELLTLNDALTDRLAGRYVPPPLPAAPAGFKRSGLGLDLHGLTGMNGSLASPAVDDGGLLTPRGSRKGKERAEPDPEPMEQVTTPTFVLESDQEDADHDDEDTHGLPHGLRGLRGMPIPAGEGGEEYDEENDQMERSKSWVEEEGEVFRKGTRLLGPEEMEGDYDSEELRQELLDAEVDRPPPRPIVDDDFDTLGGPTSPRSPSPTTPTPISAGLESPDTNGGPRAYVPRRKTSQASMTSVSSGGSGRSVDTVKS